MIITKHSVIFIVFFCMYVHPRTNPFLILSLSTRHRTFFHPPPQPDELLLSRLTSFLVVAEGRLLVCSSSSSASVSLLTPSSLLGFVFFKDVFFGTRFLYFSFFDSRQTGKRGRERGGDIWQRSPGSGKFTSRTIAFIYGRELNPYTTSAAP
ncbi:hypothetical protein ILYODFUR_034112 [Ilyodon furcidens]|uniref:Secreted protein n=1 Tax=Ilyodon furcidens TaxID=33524 RepID=A0ABV0SRI7_9TELE